VLLGEVIVSPDVDAVIVKPVGFAVMAGVALKPKVLLCGALFDDQGMVWFVVVSFSYP